MEKPDEVKCANCLFYSHSRCKFYPPTFVYHYTSVNMTSNGGFMNGSEGHDPSPEFPYVPPSEWCGQFSAKDGLTHIEWAAWIKGLNLDEIQK